MNRSGRGKPDRAARAEGGRQEGRSQGRGKYGSRPMDRSLSFQHKVPLPGSEILRYEFGIKRNHRAWRDFMRKVMDAYEANSGSIRIRSRQRCFRDQARGAKDTYATILLRATETIRHEYKNV